MRRSSSPLRRFQLLLDFLRRTAPLPPLWTASYLRTLYPALSTAIRHEYVCWTDPADWITVIDCLGRIGETEWGRGEQTFKDTVTAAWEKCCLTHGGMRALRELHGLLHAHGLTDTELSAREWADVVNADATGRDAFQVYCDTLRRHAACPPALQQAFERWRHARSDGSAPGVILLDADGVEGELHPGLILHIDLDAKRSERTRMHFRNPLDRQNTETMRQLAACADAASAVVSAEFRRGVPACEWTVGFHEHEATYAGESMGLAAALAMMFHLQKGFNRAVRWRLRPNLVCSGGIDAEGSVRPLPDTVLASKITAAFFSPADTLLLPAENAENARGLAQSLQQRYPERRFEIVGIGRLSDCPAAPSVIHVQQRTAYDRLAEFVRAHSVLLLLSLVLLLAAAGAYFWWKSIYGYPDLEFTIDAKIEESALVFNPHRSADWQFRDFDRVVAPRISFGDLETGADATRNVYLWNMTPTDLDVRLAIEGAQADQWYISWHGGEQPVPATSSLRVMIKYVPTHAAVGNTARFTVRDPRSGALLTELQLTGAAGPPQSAGYALSFDGVDDMLFFGEQAIAFARDEATIEWWMRLDADTVSLLSNTRNSPQAPAMSNMGLAVRNDTISLTVGNNDSVIPLPRPITGDGLWHHFAVAFSREGGHIRFLCDGDVLLEKREEFIIEWVGRPYVTFGAYNNEESVQSPFRGALDELRVWDRALPPDTIRARMHRRVDGLSPGLLGYWDFDVIAEVSAHNANERTQDGQLLGRPAYIRSSAPLEAEGSDIRVVPGPRGGRAIELQSCRWLQCGSDPIRMSRERSYAVRFRRDGDGPARILSVMNQDAYFFLQTDLLKTTGSTEQPIPTKPGWNTAVARIDAKQNLELFVNGSRVLVQSDNQFRRGPSYRYEGLQLGIFNDKYNDFGPKPYDHARALLRTRRAVADFRVWDRRISDAAVAAYERGAATPDGLVAHWPLDTLPDADGNCRDAVGGHLMHLWKYRGWE